MKFDDLTGKVFERLTVIQQAESNKYGHTRWKCSCICGKQIEALASDLKAMKRRSCGCLKRELCSIARQLPQGEGAFNSLYAQYAKSARYRGITFSLTKKEFADIVDKTCHYCGSLPSLKIYSENRMEQKNVNGNFTYTGVDRKDNNDGYTTENCVTCCKICNFGKNTMTYVEFVNHLNQVASFRTKQAA